MHQLPVGQEVGTLTITAPGVPETTVPVFAGAEVEEGGIFTQIKTGIKDLMSSAPEPASKTEELPLPAEQQPAEAPPP